MMNSVAVPRRRSYFLLLLCVVLFVTGMISGCARLNLWEGPSYRDDPIVS